MARGRFDRIVASRFQNVTQRCCVAFSKRYATMRVVSAVRGRSGWQIAPSRTPRVRQKTGAR
eukprot:1830071-Lingulodinium_polyedra.AAC.1